MSYPSLATTPTGASVVAATSPRQRRLKWNDPRIRPWIIAGVVAGHAQAATLTCLGFFIIDRLQLAPHGSEGPISIVMMAGASATLAAQWGLIPRLRRLAARADPVGRIDRRGRARRDHARRRPLRHHHRLRAGLDRLRPDPAGLHRRRVAGRSACRAGRSRRRDHVGQRHQLRRRAGDRHGALRARPAPAVRGLGAAADRCLCCPAVAAWTCTSAWPSRRFAAGASRAARSRCRPAAAPRRSSASPGSCSYSSSISGVTEARVSASAASKSAIVTLPASIPRRSAVSPARRTRSSRSAPVNRSVRWARLPRSTSLASGMPEVWIARIRRRPAVSGVPT